MTKPIPTTLYIRGNRIKIKHNGQDRTPICGICKTKGHYRTDCPRNRETEEEKDDPTDGTGLTQEIGPRRMPNPRGRLSLDVGTNHYILEIKHRPKTSNFLWGFDGLGLNNINNKNIKHLNPLENKTTRSKTAIIFRTDDMESALPLYERERASTRSLQPHINGTHYSCNFFHALAYKI